MVLITAAMDMAAPVDTCSRAVRGLGNVAAIVNMTHEDG